MAGIVEFIKQLTVFMIMAKMVLHLRPKQEYEKYLKLVVGIMVLALVVERVIGLWQGGESVLWEKILSASY